MAPGKPEGRKVKLASGLTADVLVKGRGAPLLFLHPTQGRVWSPFLDGLAESHTVYAPLTPGADERPRPATGNESGCGLSSSFILYQRQSTVPQFNPAPKPEVRMRSPRWIAPSR